MLCLDTRFLFHASSFFPWQRDGWSARPPPLFNSSPHDCPYSPLLHHTQPQAAISYLPSVPLSTPANPSLSARTMYGSMPHPSMPAGHSRQPSWSAGSAGVSGSKMTAGVAVAASAGHPHMASYQQQHPQQQHYYHPPQTVTSSNASPRFYSPPAHPAYPASPSANSYLSSPRAPPFAPVLAPGASTTPAYAYQSTSPRLFAAGVYGASPTAAHVHSGGGAPMSGSLSMGSHRAGSMSPRMATALTGPQPVLSAAGAAGSATAQGPSPRWSVGASLAASGSPREGGSVFGSNMMSRHVSRGGGTGSIIASQAMSIASKSRNDYR